MNLNFVKTLSFLFKTLMESLFPIVFLLNGQEKKTNENLKVIFAGRQTEKYYIQKIVFNGNCEELSLGSIFFLRLFYLIKFNRYNCSLAIIECLFPYRMIFQGIKDFYIPAWVLGIVKIPIIVKSKSLKEDLRQIKKKKLEYLISTNLEDIHNFYYNMYVPTVRRSHQKGNIETRYDEIKERVNDGVCELLLVLQEKNPIAGALIRKDQEIPHYWRNGSSDIKYSAGVMAATYYFSANYLAEKGYRKMNVGATRSFLSDGILKYKNKFNHELIGTAGKRGFVFKCLKSTNSLKNVYMNNPFIYKIDDELRIASFIEGRDSDAFGNCYDIQGVSQMTCFQFNDREDSFEIVQKK